MSINRRILGNASILAGSQVIAQLANFGFVIVFARAFGADLLGEYSFALSLGALLAAVVGLGSRKLILRSASQEIDQWRVLTGIFLPVQVALSALMLMLIVVGSRLAEVPNNTVWIITLVCAFQLIAPFSALLTAGFSAQERMSYSGFSEALRSVSVFALGTATVWIGLQAELTAAVMPVIAIAVVIAVYSLAHREFGAPDFRFDAAEFAAVVHRTLPFLGITLATILFVRVGVLMLRAISGAQAVGVFSAAERMVTAAVLLQSMFINAMFPQLVKLWRDDRGKFRKLAEQGQRMIVLVTLPGATILALFSEDIVLLLFGSGYSGADSVLRVVAWMLVIRGIYGITSTVAIAQDRQADVVASKFVGLLVLIGACGALAPRYGATGLAVAVILAELNVLITIVWRLGRAALISSIWAPVSRTLAACLVAASAAFALQPYGLWIRAGAVFGIGILSLWLCRAVRWNDIQFLAAVVRARPSA